MSAGRRTKGEKRILGIWASMLLGAMPNALDAQNNKCIAFGIRIAISTEAVAVLRQLRQGSPEIRVSHKAL